jgi:hypothetical protein
VRCGPIRGLSGGAGGVEQGRRKTNQSLLVSTPILDPNLPADHSQLSSGEMRGQFQAISGTFDDIRGRLITLTPLDLCVSNSPSRSLGVTSRIYTGTDAVTGRNAAVTSWPPF